MKSNRGFTLIELMVAMTVFIILVALCAAIFIETLHAQQAITNITTDNESASEALEQISRDVRTGYSFVFDTSTETLVFISAQENNTAVGYEYSSSTQSIDRCLDADSTDDCGINNGGQGVPGDYQPITPPGVIISGMSFIPSNLSLVPRITILVAVTTPTSTQPQINTYLETTVSSRNY